MAVEIKLSKTGKHAGKYVAIVDDIDADLDNFNWSVQLSPNVKYAIRHTGYAETRTRLFLHRVILERVLGRSLEKGESVDHYDNNGLNCSRCNLRVATNPQNAANRSAQKNNKSGYKGVALCNDRPKWQSKIKVNGKAIHLGYFDTPEKAYAAYCEAAVKYFGEFANFGTVAQPERTPIQLPLFALESESAA